MLGYCGKDYLLRLSDYTWQQFEGRAEDKRGFGAVCYNKKVYKIGGIRGLIRPSKSVHIFSVRENKWSVGPKLTIQRLVFDWSDILPNSFNWTTRDDAELAAV